MIDIEQARRTLRERRRIQAEANLALHRRASADAGRIIAMITDHYHPRRVIQWGSVLRPEQFDDRSDIDLAVEGVTGAEFFFKLLGEAMEMTSFPLDIVQLERVEPEFAEIIQSKGKVVYER